MLIETCENAYAKVNFGLNVLPKRNDGFHNIESIFQTVDLVDKLSVSFIEGKSECIATCDTMILPEKNTLTTSYQAFCEISGLEVPGVNVKIKKGIPAGGGLGGGSSDAAALIRVLEKKCGIKLSNEQLDYIAGKTGSDVFFFMNCDSEGKGCALVSGRGEKVEKIIPRTDLILLLIFPKFRSSTKEAYALVDEYLALGEKVNGPDFADYERIYNAPVNEWSFINTFMPALVDRYSKLDKAICDLKSNGSLYQQMSGSGSTVYGVFASEQQAINAGNLLAETWNCKIVRAV